MRQGGRLGPLRITRRQALSGLLATFAVAPAAWAAGPALPVRRAWKGRGQITVLATGYGDPRVPPGTDDAEAMLLATSILDDGVKHLVAAAGVPVGDSPAGGDIARALAGSRPNLTLHDGGAEEFDAVMALARVAWGLAPPSNQAFRARRLALALTPFDLEHPALSDYAKLRKDALLRRDRARAALALAAQSRVAGLPRKALVVTRALGAEQLCAALEADGRGGRLVATEEGATLLDGEALFWAGIEAGLPEPGEEGLVPWARALKPFHEAFEAWPGRATFAEGIAAIGQDTPVLDGALRDHVLEASALLAARGFGGIPEGLPLHEGTGTTHAMSYDSFTHRLKVSDVLADVSVPMTAAVLLHELTHVADVAAASAVVGTDPRGLALLIDRLPVGIGTGLLCCMEDKAYHQEVLAIPGLGLRLPPADVPLAEGASIEAQLAHMLSMLREAGPASSRWLAMIDRFVGIAQQPKGG